MDSISQAHARLLHDRSIQFHRETLHVSAPPPRALEQFGAPASDLSWLAWVVLAVVLALAAVPLIGSLRRGSWKRRRAAPPSLDLAPAAPARAELSLPEAPLDEADVLAQSGQFGAAVHVLLLRGIAALERRYPGLLAPSLTSRDIAVLDGLPPSLRTPFAAMAASTERAVFARRTLGPADWDECRRLYAGLTGARS